MKLSGSKGSSTYLLPKSLLFTQCDLFPLTKTKSALQDKHLVLSHVSQLLYLSSHLM